LSIILECYESYIEMNIMSEVQNKIPEAPQNGAKTAHRGPLHILRNVTAALEKPLGGGGNGQELEKAVDALLPQGAANERTKDVLNAVSDTFGLLRGGTGIGPACTFVGGFVSAVKDKPSDMTLKESLGNHVKGMTNGLTNLPANLAIGVIEGCGGKVKPGVDPLSSETGSVEGTRNPRTRLAPGAPAPGG
jgi:hypothetical protein